MVNSALIFCASIFGIFAYFIDDSASIFIGFFILCVAGTGLTAAAHMLTKHDPVTATWLFLSWRIVPLTFVFLGAFSSAWLSLNILDYLPVSFSEDPLLADAVKAEKSTLKSLTTTAVTTLLAALALDAARDPESGFWPAARQKKAFKAAFHNSPVFDLTAEDIEAKEVRHAIQDLAAAYIGPRTMDNKAKGWSFRDRLHRAAVIRQSLETFKAHQVKV